MPPDAAIRTWHTWHTSVRLAALALCLAASTRTAHAQDCACPVNTGALPENGAEGVPRNTLVWLSAEKIFSLAGASSGNPAALDDAIRGATLLLAPSGEQVAFDITHLGGHAVLHPVQLLEPGQYSLRLWASGSTLLYSNFTVDDHVDLEPSSPPTVATSADGTLGGASGEGGFGGQLATPPQPWSPNCGPGATPLFIHGNDPVLLSTFDGYEWPATSLQSGELAASHFVSQSLELVAPDYDWSGTSCFFGDQGERNLHVGSYDLAGNFSGWTDVTPIVVNGPLGTGGHPIGEGHVGGSGGYGDYCHVGSGGLCLVDYGEGDDTIEPRRDEDGCSCSAAGADTSRSLAGASLGALALALVVARRARRSFA